MGELRKDYILDEWVIISSGRKSRPRQFKKLESMHVKKDFFAPGMEHTTPPEIGRTGTEKRWKTRWFANKFAALEPEGQHEIKTDNTFYTYSSSFGYHWVMVEHPDSEKQLSQLTKKQITEVLEVYNKIIDDLGSRPHIKYVDVFKNHGPKGGTSLIHTHSQIMALNHVPQRVRKEIEACKRHDGCPYCKIIESEKKSERKCFENSNFVAFAPYASRYNYEVWIFPKKHIKRMDEVKKLSDLAEIMKKVLKKIDKIADSYNYALHYAPDGEDLHFHIEVWPRIAVWGGFELGSGEIINSVAPEDAAAFYRGEKRV